MSFTASVTTASRMPVSQLVELEMSWQLLTAHDGGFVQVRVVVVSQFGVFELHMSWLLLTVPTVAFVCVRVCVEGIRWWLGNRTWRCAATREEAAKVYRVLGR